MMGSDPALITGKIIMNREVAAGHFLLSLRVAPSFSTPAPGQFIMVKVSDSYDPFLRRPFSVHDFKRFEDRAVVEILYRVTGRGTMLLSHMSPSAEVEITGPLGHGFTIFPERKNVILIAGGIGLAPISFLAGYYSAFSRRNGATNKDLQCRVICYLGARTSDALVGVERIKELCKEVRISTDDGSRGYHGNITDLFRKDIGSYNPEDAVVYACGPTPMLKALAEIFAGEMIQCQVSMEERMACGIGACLGCAVSVKGAGGETAYKRVCKDGPVFPIHDIVWK
jgi:dihydroorotate dehydrogenase electron transfer subunit